MMEDGDILTLSPGRPAITDSAPVGRLVLDGNRLVPLKGEVMSARRRMLFNGIVVASLAVDQAGRVLGRPKVSAPGLLDPEDPETDRVADDFAGHAARSCRRICGVTMRRWRMRRGRRCGARSGGGWASGRWWMCI